VGREIERRFFVKEGFHPGQLAFSKDYIYQTYLMGTGSWATRGRMTVKEDFSENFLITLKQGVDKLLSKEINMPTNKDGYLDFCSECLPPLRKMRYNIEHGDLTFEVDLFQDNLYLGLIVAEIELPSKETYFIQPDWLGEEITGRKGTSNFAMWRQMHGIKKK
jgi:adenylate cyclase